MLRPYGWSRGTAPDEAQNKAIGDKMRDLARDVHGMCVRLVLRWCCDATRPPIHHASIDSTPCALLKKNPQSPQGEGRDNRLSFSKSVALIEVRVVRNALSFLPYFWVPGHTPRSPRYVCR